METQLLQITRGLNKPVVEELEKVSLLLPITKAIIAEAVPEKEAGDETTGEYVMSLLSITKLAAGKDHSYGPVSAGALAGGITGGSVGAVRGTKKLINASGRKSYADMMRSSAPVMDKTKFPSGKAGGNITATHLNRRVGRTGKALRLASTRFKKMTGKGALIGAGVGAGLLSINKHRSLNKAAENENVDKHAMSLLAITREIARQVA